MRFTGAAVAVICAWIVLNTTDEVVVKPAPGMPSEGLKIANVTISNNIFAAGERQITSSGGGPRNCAFRPDALGPDGVLNSCFEHAVFTRNIIIGGKGAWPKGNMEVRDEKSAGLFYSQDQYGGTYKLCRSAEDAPACKRPSPGSHAASDGKDIGADVDAVEKAIAGIFAQ